MKDLVGVLAGVALLALSFVVLGAALHHVEIGITLAGIWIAMWAAKNVKTRRL